jgi:hypothetical protein
MNKVANATSMRVSPVGQTVCAPPDPATVMVTPENKFVLDINFSISCTKIGSVSALVPEIGSVGNSVEIRISILDEAGNPVKGMARALEISILGSNSVVRASDIVENNDGSYSLSYIPINIGNDNIQIALSGYEFADSPYGVTITSGMAISAIELPDGTEMEPGYEAHLTVIGGTSPYTWTIVEGDLPAGVTLDDQTGLITGTPAEAGVYIFTVRVRDANGIAVEQTLELTVNAAILGFVILEQPNVLTEAGFPIGRVVASIVNQHGTQAEWYSNEVNIAITKGTGEANARINRGVTRVVPV